MNVPVILWDLCSMDDPEDQQEVPEIIATFKTEAAAMKVWKVAKETVDDGSLIKDTPTTVVFVQSRATTVAADSTNHALSQDFELDHAAISATLAANEEEVMPG